VAEAATADIASGNLVGMCSLAQPSERPACLNTVAGVKVTTRNLAVGTVVTQGTQGLFVQTGTICNGGTCQTNTDPSKGLDGEQSFAQIYALEVSTTQSGPAWVTALVEEGSSWYLTGFAGATSGSAPPTSASAVALSKWAASINAPFAKLQSDLNAISGSDAVSTSAVLAGCAAVGADAQALQAYPAAPVASVNTPFQAGLTDLVKASQACAAAGSGANSTAASEIDSDFTAAGTAFTQFSTALSRALES
jgi:hypothetical protein